MTRDEFWSLIEKARGEPAALEQLLAAHDPAAIESFQAHFDELRAQAYRWDLWGAAYVLEGGCSNDGFTDFRYGLIASGRQRFEDALKDPDSLSGVDGEISNELFGYAASEAYESVTGRKMPPRGRRHPTEPSGEQWDFDDDAENRRRLPLLAAKYLGR